MQQISIILPTFNEKDNILPLIRAIHQQLQGSSYEIIVVDDQSPDRTAGLVRDAQDLKVLVIERNSDHGYAKAIRAGIEQARGEVLVLMDSDFNHDPQDIPRLLAGLSEHDCVSASRFLKGGGMSPAWRGACSGVFNMFIRIITGSKMTDNLFGFFVVKRAALTRCLQEDIFFGFGDYGMRLLFYLQKHKAKILEMPARCGQRKTGCGNKDLLKTFGQYFYQALRLVSKGRL